MSELHEAAAGAEAARLRAELSTAHETIHGLRDTVYGLETEIEDLEAQLQQPCEACLEDTADDRVTTLEEAIADLHRGVIGIYDLYELVGLR